VQPVGRGRARRWMTPSPINFAAPLLLPAPLHPREDRPELSGG